MKNSFGSVRNSPADQYSDTNQQGNKPNVKYPIAPVHPRLKSLAFLGQSYSFRLEVLFGFLPKGSGGF